MQAHSEASKQPLQAYTAYDKPRDVDKLVARINKQAIGKTFKKDGKPLLEALEGMKEELKDDKGPLACARDRWGSQAGDWIVLPSCKRTVLLCSIGSSGAL